jgi:hypothetical protein
MILCPNRSHANADNAKGSVVTHVTPSSRVAFEVGRIVARSSIVRTGRHVTRFGTVGD